TLRDQLVSLLHEPRLRSRLEREVVEGARHTEALVDPGVVHRGDPRYLSRLHECHELIVSGIEENVADLPALLDPDRVAANRLEPENVFVEVAGLVEVERGQADVGEPPVRHDVTSSPFFKPHPTTPQAPECSPDRRSGAIDSRPDCPR